MTPLSDSLSLRCLWSQGDGPSAASTGQLRARGGKDPPGSGKGCRAGAERELPGSREERGEPVSSCQESPVAGGKGLG